MPHFVAAADGSTVPPVSAAKLQNALVLQMRKSISEYYDGKLTSDDELMPFNTRNVCMR